MSPIHLAGEMAVWSEEQWAAFEGHGQRRPRAERRRARLALRRARARSLLIETAVWGCLATSVLLLLFR